MEVWVLSYFSDPLTFHLVLPNVIDISSFEWNISTTVGWIAMKFDTHHKVKFTISPILWSRVLISKC